MYWTTLLSCNRFLHQIGEDQRQHNGCFVMSILSVQLFWIEWEENSSCEKDHKTLYSIKFYFARRISKEIFELLWLKHHTFCAIIEVTGSTKFCYYRAHLLSSYVLHVVYRNVHLAHHCFNTWLERQI